MSEPTYYPLTQSQLMMFFQMKFCLKKNCTNICTEIVIQDDEIDQHLLMQALYLALMRAPASSVRLHTQPDKTVVQYFSDAAPEKIEYLDFTGKSKEQYDKALTTWNQTPFPNKLMDTQLYNVKLLRNPEGKLVVYGCYNHTIYDAYSVMMTFRDVSEIYYALRDHTALPAELPSPVPAYEVDYKYRESDKCKEDYQYFDEVVCATEPQFTTTNGRNSKEFKQKDPKARYGTYAYNPFFPGDGITLDVPTELNNAITAYALAAKMSPQSAYLLALRSYLAKVCEVDDVLLMNSVARRATLAQKRAGGTMVNSVPIRTVFGADKTFEEGCRILYTTQCDVYRHANHGCGDTLNLIDKKFNCPKGKTYQSIGTSYQPYFSGSGTIPATFRRMPNGCETQLIYMTISPRDTFGNMGIDYSYMKNVVSESNIRTVHAFMMRFLEIGIANPQKPIAEIVEEAL